MKIALSGIAALALAAAGIGAVATAPGANASGGSGCQLVGSATFTPNGPGVTETFGYSLTGALSSCVGTTAGAPAEGSIEVGQVVTRSVPVTLADGTVVQGTAQYAEPLATGTGTVPVNSCGSSGTAGTAIVSWPDGTTTVLDYTTSSAAAAVGLSGSVVASVTTALVPGSASPAGSAPSSYTVATTSPVFPVGDTAEGLVAFTTETPDACTTDAGLSGVDVEGVVGVGSAD